jgi:hypothetical protein
MAFGPVIDGWYSVPAAPSSGNWMTDHRARIALEESERLQSRQRDLLGRTRDRGTPAERVLAWERRHGLRLPRDVNGRLMDLVARETELAPHQVRAEQRRRLARVNAEAAS